LGRLLSEEHARTKAILFLDELYFVYWSVLCGFVIVMMVIRRTLHLMGQRCDAEKAAVGMHTPPSAVDSEDRFGDGEGGWETVAVSQNAARRCVFSVH